MNHLRLYRAFVQPILQTQFPRTAHTMPPKANNNSKNDNNNNNNRKKEKKPPLTHFLCLPLVNSTSLPQLESSLEAFKAAIPACAEPEKHAHPHQHPHPSARSLIPDGAVRPVGTLHLTLGVMSLPSKERLDEALRFFHSLDLASTAREAGRIASQRQREQDSMNIEDGASDTPRPFKVSLESLHALPRARSATVLHAAPVDPTARLYPFCEMLRDKFLDAGFLVGESKGNENENEKPPEAVDQNPSNGACPELKTEDQQSLLEEMPTDVAAEPSHSQPKPPRQTARPKQKRPRPLLLHATVVNTIYVKGRRGAGAKNHRTNRHSFDAREMLAHYNDYYHDAERTRPRSELPSVDEHTGAEMASKNPYIWARDIPLESICICDMGAKKLDCESDGRGMHARLGQKYHAVTERALDFGYQT